MKYIIIAILSIIIVGIIQAYRNKKGKLPINNSDLLEVGTLLFPDLKTEFETFFNSFLKDKKSFLSENEKLLENYDNFELDKIKPLEVLYIFGDSREKLLMTDWRGEEDEREIEHFLEDKLSIRTAWTNVNKKRKEVDLEKQRDGEFIKELFKSIDKDLETINKSLIFLDLAWDSYVYTVLDKVSYKTITDKSLKLFHGSEKLR
jgi:uncharacterized FlaG/YvyC family protein